MRFARHLFAFGLLCALVAPIGGCAQYQAVRDGWSALTGATVSPKAVIVAANAFDALEATATNYLTLKRCDGRNGPLCRDPKATAIIVPAVRSGRAARDELIQFVKDHPGQLGPTGPFDVLKSATATLKQTLDIYRTN